MNYSEIKTLFIGNLKRSDVTATQITNWIAMGIQRAQRMLNVPAAETVLETEIAESSALYAIPNDFLKLISLSADGGQGYYTELTRTDLNKATMLSRFEGQPMLFAQDGAFFRIGPKPPVGGFIKINYLADFSALSADSDSNWLTDIAPDLLVNAAMVPACRYFRDPRAPEYEAAFLQGIEELNQQASRDALTNAAISPSYGFDFDDL